MSFGFTFADVDGEERTQRLFLWRFWLLVTRSRISKRHFETARAECVAETCALLNRKQYE
jgi:hypothetical protein